MKSKELLALPCSSSRLITRLECRAILVGCAVLATLVAGCTRHPDPYDVPGLIKAFEGADQRTVDYTTSCLAAIGEPAVPSLIEALSDPDKSTHICAAGTLGMIGPKAKAAVPHLIAFTDAHGKESDEYRIGTHALNKIDADAAAMAGLEMTTAQNQ